MDGERAFSDRLHYASFPSHAVAFDELVWRLQPFNKNAKRMRAMHLRGQQVAHTRIAAGLCTWGTLRVRDESKVIFRIKNLP